MQRETRQRVVIVTGGSRGLGRELALTFGRRGDRVVVNYVSNDQSASSTVNAVLQSGGEASACRADVGISSDVDRLFRETLDRWGTVDVLINNAGITKDGVLLRMSENDWDDVLNTNLGGAFHCVRAASGIMARQRRGHIINIASIVGLQGREGQANYSAAKAGLIGLTKALAIELGSDNVQVNGVLPGYLPTAMGDTVPAAIQKRVAQQNALKRSTEIREVADFIYHLSGMENVSGQIFNLDSRIL